MKRNHYLVLSIYLLIIIFSVLNMFFKNIFTDYTILLFLLCLIILSYFLVGFEKNKNIISKDIILSIVVYSFTYYLIIYVLGYFIGFYRNIYSTEFISIIKNIFPVIISIVLGEILRYMLNIKIKDNKKMILLSLLTFTLLNNSILLASIISKENLGAAKIIDYIGIMILPNFTSNILLTYLSINIGYKSCMVFRMFMELPVYIIPIFPNFGTYIEAIIKTTLPIIILWLIYKNIEKNKKKTIVIIKKEGLLNSFRIGAVIITIVLVYFVSGVFKYKALVIATGSMQPKINIGDVVIVKKLERDNLDKLKIGEVLVYKKDNIVVCHRITNIIKTGNYLYFETKGDNNNSPDDYLTNADNVVGTAICKVPFVGYPSVMLNEILSRN